jgi:hypothetical protein
VGLASSAVRGEEDRELTFEVGDGAMGSGMAMGVGDDDGSTVDGVKAEGGVGNGVGTMGSRTATGVEDDDGGTAGSIEAEGGVGNGVGATGSGMVRWGRGRRWGWCDGATSREAASMAWHRGRRRRRGRETWAA